MISFIPDLRHPFLRPPGRNPMPTLPRPSPRRDYGSSFDILGTAHFTRRSILDSIEAASSGVHSSVAIELDKQRFDDLDMMAYSVATPFRRVVEGEFVAATDAFGNRDGDVWLIDWGMEEIDDRLRMTLTREEIFTWNRVSRQLFPYEVAGARFWEMGRKEEALEYLNLTTKAMRDYFPSLHRVLIEERNLIMAARLLDIANQNVEQIGKTLVLVGMAHVGGLKELLKEPGLIQSGFEKYGLNYSSPSRIRRVKVN
jgi:pheromone shutdown protein TraB